MFQRILGLQWGWGGRVGVGGGGSLLCWCVMHSAAALRDVWALVVKHTLQLDSVAHCWSSALLQHLASCFWQLCREETTCSERASSK